MPERRKLSPEEEAKVHPPTPGLNRVPGRELTPGAPSPKEGLSVLEQLMRALGLDQPGSGAPAAPMPGENPAAGVVGAIGQNVMQPARRAIDWLGNLGK